MVMATQQPPAIRRFTADEVWRMVEIGLLHPDEPYELIDGQLWAEAHTVHLPVPGT